MIINPIVAAAAVAARAIMGFTFPGAGEWSVTSRRPTPYSSHQDPSYREVFPFNPYFVEMDMEVDSIGHQHQSSSSSSSSASDIEDINAIHDAEILMKEQATTQTFQDGQQGNRNDTPPPLPNTNNPIRLLGLEPGADFDTIKRAYKNMVKLYHPDVLLGPDASPEERKEVNWDFARINSAFDILKRKENEQVFEYDVYVDGQRVTRKVVAVSDDEGSRHNDPYHISYERIRRQAEYRKRHPKKRSWYEPDLPDYQPNYNGYGGDEPYTVSAHSKGNWRVMKNYNDHTNNNHVGFGPIPSHERVWEERSHHNVEKKMQAKRNIGYGVNPRQDHWWDDRSAFDYEYSSHNSARDNNNQNAVKKQQGYPYKDSPRWGERAGFDEYLHRPPYHNFDYESSPQDQFPVKGKWWKEEESTIFDGFAP